MIVDSSATTGVPAASASATSGATLSIGCGVVDGLVVIGGAPRWGLGGGQVGRDERGGEVGAHGVGRGAGQGGEHLAVAGGLDDVGAVEQGVHVAGGHRVTGTR